MYGLRFSCRALCSVEADHDNHKYLVATHTLTDNNEIHLIQYSEDNNEINNLAIYQHKPEIWSIASSNTHQNIFASVYTEREAESNDSLFKATIWSIPSADNQQAKSPNKSKSTADEYLQLDRQLDLTGNTGRINKVLFHPVQGEHKIVTTNSANACIYDLNQAQTTLNTSNADNALIHTKNVEGGVEAACWDVHHSSILVTTNDTNIRIYDLRENNGKTEAQTILNAHEGLIRCVDYNPNKPYHIVTGSEDRNINIYDLRKVNKSSSNASSSSNNCYLRQLTGHNHWIWSVKFNLFHDQLILTAGTDVINLWSIVSTSSAPLGELEASTTVEHSNNSDRHNLHNNANTHNSSNNKHDKSNDRLIKNYLDHDSSIYSISWSSVDAWSFASASVDGRIVINHVPPAEKFQILL
jgi:WD40 repeat protein